MHDEWLQQPFVEINLRKGKCDTKEEELFTVPWGGTERGCYNVGIYPWVETYSDFQSKNIGYKGDGTTVDYTNFATRNEDCNSIWYRSEVKQDQYYGYRICGKRGGPSYKNLKRPDAENVCPTGT